jgi:hypothetical protein
MSPPAERRRPARQHSASWCIGDCCTGTGAGPRAASGWLAVPVAEPCIGAHLISSRLHRPRLDAVGEGTANFEIMS